MMIKLYKTIGGKTHYWEAWDHDRKIVIHWGLIGTEGESKDIALKPGETAEAAIKRESSKPKAEGYEEIESSLLLYIEYKCDGWGGGDDLEKRYKVEDLMNELLGWTGNGHCDGGDIGSGTIGIYSYVIDRDAAAKTAVEGLKKDNLLDGAIIATRNTENDDEEYLVHWPPGAEWPLRPI